MLEQSYDNKIIHGTKIGFIGLGKLGMPVAETIGKKGFEVNGYDVQPRSSDIVNIKNNLKDAVVDRDIIFIAVPTPHAEGYDGRMPTSHMPAKDFDYTEVKNVLKQLNDLCSNEQVISLISTVLPGTVRKQLDPIYEPSNIVYNPYLIAMGTVEWDTRNPEMVMIGTESGWEGKGCTRRTNKLIDFYNNLCDNPPRVEAGKWEEIESMKIFYNTFISTKLALVNMMQDVSNKLGNIDVDKVTQALAKSTQRIVSTAYMKAGMGDGGACHPRDNIALRWLAKDLGLGYDLFEGIMTARERQAENMALAILEHGKNVHFTSDSYKPGTDLVDGSYSLLVQHYVVKHGGQIVHGFDNPVEVIVRVHESDKVEADNKTIIFDPWRTYPKADNVVHYGKYE
jgi:UDPglucose 6-dehydrogenase